MVALANPSFEPKTHLRRPKAGAPSREVPFQTAHFVPLNILFWPKTVKVLPWVDVCAGGLGAGKTGGAGTRGVSLNAAIGGRTGYSDTNGGESSNN